MKLCDRGINAEISFWLEVRSIICSSFWYLWSDCSSKSKTRSRGEDGMDELGEIVMGEGCIYIQDPEDGDGAGDISCEGGVEELSRRLFGSSC